MVATNQNFTIYVGEDVSVPFTIADEDITGWGMAAYIRHPQTDELIATLTTADGDITLTDPDAEGGGTGAIALSDDLTDTLTYEEYDWSLWRTDAGNERVYATGTITVDRTSRTGRPWRTYRRFA